MTNHDVVYVATQNDSVYAFDAKTGGQLKCKSLLVEAGAMPIMVPANGGVVQNADMVPKIGIVGTPVIDVNLQDIGRSTLYVVSKYQVVSGTGTSYVQRLNALDVTTLEHRPQSPSDPIQASYPGNGNGFDDPGNARNMGDNDGHGNVHFNPLRANQRSGLLLLNGVVYVCWASHGDTNPYHGWVIGFNSTTLKPLAVFNTTPNRSTSRHLAREQQAHCGRLGRLHLPLDRQRNFRRPMGSGHRGPRPGTLDARGFPIKSNYGDSIIKLTPDLANGRLMVVNFSRPTSRGSWRTTTSTRAPVGS